MIFGFCLAACPMRVAFLLGWVVTFVLGLSACSSLSQSDSVFHDPMLVTEPADRPSVPRLALTDTPAAAQQATVIVVGEVTIVTMPATSSPSIPTATATAQVKIIANAANVRSGPGVDYERIGTAALGEVLALLATNNDQTWYHIRLGDGTVGWVGSTVAMVISPAGLAIPNAAAVPPDNNPQRDAPTPTPLAGTASPTSAWVTVCDCSGDHYDCTSFSSYGKAQACFNYCFPKSGDIHELDLDHDHSVCESLP
jgi:hypothetical protein